MPRVNLRIRLSVDPMSQSRIRVPDLREKKRRGEKCYFRCVSRKSKICGA